MSKRRRHHHEEDLIDDDYDETSPAHSDEQDADADQTKSKSELKREMNALQDLGRDLVELSDKDLTKIPMSEALFDAIQLARKIQNTRGGYRRQLQLIGKLMRLEDAAPIQASLDSIRLTGLQSTTQFHALERWRDRIISEGQSALDEFVEQHPQADRQQLRQLLLNIQREQKNNKPPKSARQLFKYLRELSEQDEAD